MLQPLGRNHTARSGSYNVIGAGIGAAYIAYKGAQHAAIDRNRSCNVSGD